MHQQAYLRLGARYTVQHAVNWVETLAAETELAEKRQYQQLLLHQQQQQQQEPITLQGTRLSSPSFIPATAPWTMPIGGMMGHISPKSPESSSPKCSCHECVGDIGKRDFSHYMTKWLSENWTNPYPDEDGLDQIASDCKTTKTVMSNWLINARTRKWRPAIVDACKLRRPARLLGKDSLAIFAGQDVADLNDILRSEEEREQEQQDMTQLATVALPPIVQCHGQTLNPHKPAPHRASSLTLQSEQRPRKRLKASDH
jgi:Homeobox KN domain